MSQLETIRALLQNNQEVTIETYETLIGWAEQADTEQAVHDLNADLDQWGKR